MKRELRFGAAALPRRPLWSLVFWSLPEAVPSAASGYTVARAADAFLAGRPATGVTWLAGMLLAAVVGAVATRQVYRRLGDLVEPFRDALVRRVVDASLRRGAAAGRAEDGAVARLTRQTEVVRDTYGGLIMAVRGFTVTLIGVGIGAMSLAPVIVLLILPPFLVGFGAFAATLGVAAERQRTAVLADEDVATTAGTVLSGLRDIAGCGIAEHAARFVAAPVVAQAAAERALGRVAAWRTLSFGVGGFGPLVVLLAAGPWLLGQGLTVGAVLGGLTYVLYGLYPALSTVIGGVGGSGLRYVVTLGRLLDATEPPPPRPAGATATPLGHELVTRGLTFGYGPGAAPVLRGLDLAVAEGGHLAILGPSGIGKSTLAGLLCGLLAPDAGEVRVGGVSCGELPAEKLATVRVLIPQEAYVFTGTVRENLRYLRPDATDAELEFATAEVGAWDLVARLGGWDATVAPRELSAGERQLIALVRAYLSPAPVAVLDEATCHLDPAAERRAESAFAARPGTLIVIAHRVSSALRAERVLLMDGETVLAGGHRELLAASELYASLVGHWFGDGVGGGDAERAAYAERTTEDNTRTR